MKEENNSEKLENLRDFENLDFDIILLVFEILHPTHLKNNF